MNKIEIEDRYNASSMKKWKFSEDDVPTQKKINSGELYVVIKLKKINKTKIVMLSSAIIYSFGKW